MYVYIYIYIDSLGRGALATYAVASAESDCLPTAADRLAYPSADAPLFALAMAAALRDACTSKNRCQKPRLSLRSIF